MSKCQTLTLTSVLNSCFQVRRCSCSITPHDGVMLTLGIVEAQQWQRAQCEANGLEPFPLWPCAGVGSVRDGEAGLFLVPSLPFHTYDAFCNSVYLKWIPAIPGALCNDLNVLCCFLLSRTGRWRTFFCKF